MVLKYFCLLSVDCFWEWTPQRFGSTPQIRFFCTKIMGGLPTKMCESPPNISKGLKIWGTNRPNENLQIVQ